MKTPRIVKSVGHIDEELINDAVKSEKSSRKNVWIKWTSLAACFAVILIVAVVAGPIMSGNRNIAPSVDSGNVNPVIDNSDTNTSSNIEETFSQNHTEEIGSSVNDEETNTPISNDVTDSSANNKETKPAVNNETTKPTFNNEYMYEKSYFYKVDEGAFSTYIGGRVIDKNKVNDKIADVSVTAGWKNAADEWLSNENLKAEIYMIEGVSADTAVALKFIDKGEAVTTTHYYVIMNPDADLSAVEDYIIPKIAPNNPGDEIGEEEIAVNEIVGEEIVVGYTNQFANE